MALRHREPQLQQAHRAPSVGIAVPAILLTLALLSASQTWVQAAFACCSLLLLGLGLASRSAQAPVLSGRELCAQLVVQPAIRAWKCCSHPQRQLHARGEQTDSSVEDSLSSRTTVSLVSTCSLQIRKPYISTRRPCVQQVFFKMHGVELKQLPRTLGSALCGVVATDLPHLHLSSLALRSGCVLLSMDLTLATPTAVQPEARVSTTEGLVSIMSKALTECGLGEALELGTPMELQTDDGVLQTAWDDSTGSYIAQPSSESLAASVQQAAECQLLRTMPTVCCLTDKCADSSSSDALSFRLQLQLPHNCRLQGWQPDSATVPNTITPAPTHDRPALTAPVMDVQVLVRHKTQGYLPVTLDFSTHDSLLNDDIADGCVDIQVSLPCALDPGHPSVLDLELWCRLPLPCSQKRGVSGAGPPACQRVMDVCVSTQPVLVLPSQWRAAATELEQYFDNLGGVAPKQLLVPEQLGAREREELQLDDASHVLSDVVALVMPSDSTATHDAQREWGCALLHHFVNITLGETARFVVAQMEASERQLSPGAAAPATTTRAWFSHCALPADGQGQGGLLHAVMASGDPDMVELVVRWGRLYGGRQWQWPWSLTDGLGRTALHVAASHPEPGVCTALLDALTAALPPHEVQAMREEWAQGKGTIACTAVELLQQTLQPQDVWEELFDVSSPTVFVTNATTVAVQVLAANVQTLPAALPQTGKAQAVQQDGPRAQMPAASSDASCTRVSPSLWAEVCQAWQWRSEEGYDVWAAKHLSGIVYSWSWVVFCLCVGWGIRAVSEGSLRDEWTSFTVHIIYLPILGISLGIKSLGSWQSWMPLVPIVHALNYTYMSTLPANRLPAWASAARGGADVVYFLVAMTTFEQNTLPFMAVSRVFLALCHSCAYAAVGIAHPLLRALVLHSLSVVVSAIVRVYRVRAFHRWRQAQAHAQGRNTAHSSSDIKHKLQEPGDEGQAAVMGKIKTS